MAAANPLLNLDPTPGAATPSRICVVNDDAAVLVSLKFVFEAAGFAVRGFASGRGLLASPAIRLADGFVLDHKPRGVDGLKLARRLRALGLKAPIVLTTGLRFGAQESLAAAIEPMIAAARVDEEIIERLTRMIEETRDIRKTT
jgi:two-component system, LuxR family, response regulator FixJ